MTRGVFFSILVGLILFCVNPLFSTTINIPDDYSTIQGGIDAAVNGDTVLVSDGTYTGDGNRDIDFAGKNILVKSLSGREYTVIDCENSGRGFHFQSEENNSAIIEGFTILNGESDVGAGILIGNSTPKIINCSFEDCGSPSSTGGAICVSNSSALTLEIINCDFIGNNAGTAGGVYCNANRDIIISGCFFEGNVGNTSGVLALGGNGTFIIEFCTFVNNIGTGNASVYYETSSEGTVIFTNCILYGNFSGYSAGDRAPIYDNVDSISCTNIYGNTPGDWIWPIENHLPINGNFSLDPLFCDTSNGNYYIHFSSPCAPANNSCVELIGALSVGCGIPPNIISTFPAQNELNVSPSADITVTFDIDMDAVSYTHLTLPTN